MGRIVLPQEYTSTLFWTAEIKVAVSKEGDKLILQPVSFVEEKDVLSIKNKHICLKCVVEEIKEHK